MRRGYRVWALRTAWITTLLVVAAGATAQAASVEDNARPASPRKLYLASHATAIDPATLPNLLDLQEPLSGGQAYVLQLDGPLTAARKAALDAAGVHLLDYLPQDAFLVHADGVQPAALRRLGFVRWLGVYAPAWKLAPGIGQRSYATAERQQLAAEGRVVVDITLLESADPQAALAQIEALGDVMVHRADRIGGNVTFTATLPLELVAALADLPQVQFVEEAPEVTLRNSTVRWIVQSNQSGYTPYYDAGLHGEGQVVGILDSQVDVNHCSFSDTEPIGPTHRKILAYNAPLGSSLHGTHVAGIAVGDAGANDNTRGVAYLAKLVYAGIPSFTLSGIYNALSQHYNQGARVHTNSWGDDGTTAYNSLTRGIDAFSYDFEDALVLFAVTNTSTLKNPENAKNLLAVGATSDAPNQRNHCSGGTGPTSDGRRKPEVYAPGCGIQSANAGTACGTTSLSGTSMASPAVAGAALLVRQYYIDGFYPTGSPNPADTLIPSGALIKATLINSAVDMTGVPGYPSNQEGWGRIKLTETLALAGGTRQLYVQDVPNASGLSTGQSADYFVAVTDPGEKLKVTLVWTDPPATAGASFALINDLNLEVIAPDGSHYWGNNFSGGQSATGGSADAVNNVEQVHIASPLTGQWTIRVSAASVPNGPQGYALVVSGAIQPELPPFTISLPNGAPTLVPPGATTDVDVEITPVSENIVSADLVWRIDGGSFTTQPLTPLGGNAYRATLPAILCGQTLEFYVTATGDGGSTRTSPSDAPSTLYAVQAGVITTVFADDMETDTGWTAGVPGDTATTGIWNRMDPEGTAAQPENDHTANGTQCWVTDGVAGGSLGARDVDGGRTTLVSPVLDLTGLPDATISYWRWYSNDAGASPNQDVFRVDITADGSNWVNVETVGPTGPEVSGGWFQHQFRVGDFITPSATVQLRFIAEDAGAGSIVEAAVDDLLIQVQDCQNPCLGDLDGDGDVDLTDLSVLLNNFGTTGATPDQGDFDGDGDVDLSDLSVLLNAFGQSCN